MKDYIIALIFLLFALVQLNDPDFLIWTPVYISVSIVAILNNRGIKRPKVILILLLLFVLGLASYIPDFIAWLKNGMPNIATEMKTSSPFIELIREFFGLLICILALAYYYKIALKTSK